MALEAKNFLMNYFRDDVMRAGIAEMSVANLLALIGKCGEYLVQFGAPDNWRRELVASLGRLFLDLLESPDEARQAVSGSVSDIIDRILPNEDREDVQSWLRENADYKRALEILLEKPEE